MYSPKNTRSGTIDSINIYTEANTIRTSPLNYLTQTEFSTTIKDLLSSFTDNNTKQAENFDAKFEKQLHTL